MNWFNFFFTLAALFFFVLVTLWAEADRYKR